MSQLALATMTMTLREAVADQCDPFDEAVRRLEEEAALEEADFDDAARVDPEFLGVDRVAEGGED